ncbi:2-C-methyl-D-erythritol 4-phosphate cytidylyltransferase [Jannaschia aquimarina]|uniref:2-C-methyl-D-erythritol 4-phosphate cytidylyltransferase n=1 Tax=Jannaschia aquimarina TaxID=935700 RepID=A0A0D1EIJ4_9RHOB|nr:2-C-methyl-D-erythritol 4-phosphate cytidylyltransferase [Jannaschia aquimarina]KIT17444.1 2-C-methyl-D-erythritol 4-phosphate cytidylyltransferase [Jannaschia aquimarina]SNS75937.1 2-C-methyl-D-erythritol 4-phosphate cytidylyltransferase/2-C-methyl-D-erythritol 4-phosphate cytidylyltransferase / 2-C-methyl-D-erythritol 2,4-cyclodiphosphate synthase [Jannaschia aquimarina]
MSVAAILVAAGRGRRMSRGTPKQYLPVAGIPILRHTIETFLGHPSIGTVAVVIHMDDLPLYRQAVAGLTDAGLLDPIAGGDSRAASVRCGLEALSERKPEKVLIHDAARPFCPHEVIGAVIEGLDRADGACAALPVVDALWRTEGGRATASVPREGLWRAQTPQGFRFDRIVEAHRACRDPLAADDVAVARAAALDIVLVPGCESNFKITTPADLARAEEIAARDLVELSVSGSSG